MQTSSTLFWLLCRRPRPSCSSRNGRKWLTSPFPPNPSFCRYGTMTVLRTPTRTPCRDTRLSASRSVYAIPVLFCSVLILVHYGTFMTALRIPACLLPTSPHAFFFCCNSFFLLFFSWSACVYVNGLCVCEWALCV